MDSLYLIGNYNIGKIIMAVVGDIETTSILLDCSATSHIFTDQAQFISSPIHMLL